MPIDVKKIQKQLYAPKRTPELIDVPQMQFAAVDGQGDPNEENGAYKQAVGLLYAVLYTIKMSPKSGLQLDGYENFVVPPLEGLWEQSGASAGDGIDYSRKQDFAWTAMIRLPDFLTPSDFDVVLAAAQDKKDMDMSPVKMLVYMEGLCVQCLHVGPYDDEPATIRTMQEYAAAQGLKPDGTRRHHELYLSDPRRAAPERLRTIIRLPVQPI